MLLLADSRTGRWRRPKKEASSSFIIWKGGILVLGGMKIFAGKKEAQGAQILKGAAARGWGRGCRMTDLCR